jgi:hypothetical protein
LDFLLSLPIRLHLLCLHHALVLLLLREEIISGAHNVLLQAAQHRLQLHHLHRVGRSRVEAWCGAAAAGRSIDRAIGPTLHLLRVRGCYYPLPELLNIDGLGLLDQRINIVDIITDCDPILS